MVVPIVVHYYSQDLSTCTCIELRWALSGLSVAELNAMAGSVIIASLFRLYDFFILYIYIYKLYQVPYHSVALIVKNICSNAVE